MKNLLDLRFKLAVLGNLSPGDGDLEKAQTKLENLVSQIRGDLELYKDAKYGFNDKKVIFDYYTCPVFANEVWKNICKEEHATLNLIVPNEEFGEHPLMKKVDSVTNLNAGIHNIGTTRSMIKWMVNQIDIAILIWDGKEYSHEGYIWSFMEECKNSHIPCIWIDKNNCMNSNWFDHMHHVTYDKTFLDQYLSDLYHCEFDDQADVENNVLFSKLWGKAYMHFVNRHKIAMGSVENVEDELLMEDYELESTDERQKANYRNLRTAFLDYDKSAVGVVKKYRESVYFRSILPFIATLFLSVGFYAETVLAFLLFPAGNMKFPLFSFLAGMGFLVYAAINCYGFYMDEGSNVAVKKRKEVFLNYRYTAEFMRNAIHFYPFGIPVKYVFSNKTEFNNSMVTKEARANVHHLMRSMEPTGYDLVQEDYNSIVKHLGNMIESQFNYHNFKILQMGQIAKKLSKMKNIMFWIGFSIVILRGGLQFAFAFMGNVDWVVHNGVMLNKFIATITNMLALVIPAWATFFSLKLTMNNFDGLKEHSEHAIESLKKLKLKVDAIQIQEDITYEMISSLSEDVISHQIAELNDWYSQTMAKKIIKL